MDISTSSSMSVQAAVLAASVIILLLSVIVLFLRKKDVPGSSASSQRKVGISEQPQATDDIVEQNAKPIIRVLYGTQTGTAERFSKQLGNELRRKYSESTDIQVLDLENYKVAEKLSKEKLVLFCMATYGDGEPTDAAAHFYEWLTKAAEAAENGDETVSLKDVSYGVFGLGNKQYEHFNAVGKKVHKCMAALGATPIIRRCDGDDDDCIEDDFDKWCNELYEILSKSDLVGGKSTQGSSDAFASEYIVEVLPPGTREVLPFSSGNGMSSHSSCWASVQANRELHTTQSDRSCVHVEVDVSATSSVTYVTGDHIGVYAQNSADVVKAVADVLGVSLDDVIRVTMPEKHSSSTNLSEPFPSPCTVRSALSYFADVLSSPHRDSLLGLAACAKDPAEAARLRTLGSHEGKQEYAEYITKSHRSLLEVLTDFPSARPSLGAFFGCIAPRLQPRFYSISSSPLLNPRSVHITCSTVKDVMPTGRVHEGVCSTWLKHASAGTKVPVFVRHSHFRLPKDTSTPLVMVGPGTGLAPFRGFIQERTALAASGSALGPAHLFFGCRNRAHDYIYQEELEAALSCGVLSHLHLAFSRESAKKDYVQHHIEQQADAVWELLHQQGAYLYVCGDAKHMARDVNRALVQIVCAKKRCSGTEAEAYLKELTDAGRYQRDVW